MSGWRGAAAARLVHGATAVVVIAALALQVALVVRNGVGPMGARLLDLASYFTIQSNLLVAVSAVALALRPDRDGPVWRVVRLDALLGITVTGVVYLTVLAPLQDLSGAPAVADIGLHYVGPALAVLAWFGYGPRHRIDRRTAWLALIWPVLFFAYTLVHGAVAGWYPYPFVDVVVHGYASVLGNAVLVTALMFGTAFLYRRGDRRLGVAPVGTAQVGTADVGTAEVELVGSWQVVRIGATPLQRVELDFAADGTVSGSTGVNRLHGGYEVRDGTLVVGRLITTLMAGPPAAMAAEARLLAVLAGPLRLVGTDAGLCLVAEPDTLVLEPAPGPTL